MMERARSMKKEEKKESRRSSRGPDVLGFLEEKPGAGAMHSGQARASKH
jgi:hypothetical protein